MSFIVDWHCHILPGIDDGSKNRSVSLQMLKEMGKQGVDIAIATPHFYAEKMDPESFLWKRMVSYNEMRREIIRLQGRVEDSDPLLSWNQNDITDIKVKNKPDHAFHLPKVILGAEVAWYAGISRSGVLKKLCIENTNLLMLEMPFCEWSDYIISEVEQICMQGITPVIVHPERYYRFQKSKEYFEMLFGLPVEIQFNAESLLGYFERKKFFSFVQQGYVLLLGSDSHDIKHRKPNLSAGRNIIRKKAGPEYLRAMDKHSNELLVTAFG